MSCARLAGKRSPGCIASAPGRISCALPKARNVARRQFVPQYTQTATIHSPGYRLYCKNGSKRRKVIRKAGKSFEYSYHYLRAAAEHV